MASKNLCHFCGPLVRQLRYFCSIIGCHNSSKLHFSLFLVFLLLTVFYKIVSSSVSLCCCCEAGCSARLAPPSNDPGSKSKNKLLRQKSLCLVITSPLEWQSHVVWKHAEVGKWNQTNNSKECFLRLPRPEWEGHGWSFSFRFSFILAFKQRLIPLSYCAPKKSSWSWFWEAQLLKGRDFHVLLICLMVALIPHQCF